MPAKKRKPSYLLHKSTGQARVRIDGRDVYLGTYGSPGSRQRYDDIVCEWLAKNEIVNATLTVDDLCLLFMKFAESYYLRKDGTPTGSIRNIREGLRFVIRLHGSTLVHQFGPRKLKAVRQAMIGDGRARTNINRLTHWIRRVFRWGVENEYVAASVYQALRAVPSLKAGRTKAIESPRVEPVADSVVNATLASMPPVVAAMVQLQLLSGARPREIRILRPCDITLGTTGVWTYRPATHKTEHHGKERRVFFGPKAQEVVRPFLDREPEEYCFRPAESGKRGKRSHYTKDAYALAVRRACKKAGVKPWSPRQLRHSKATELRERYGIEAAMLVLGHADAGMTEVYAEKNFDAAARIMREIG